MKRSYPYTGSQNGQQAPINHAGGTGITGPMGTGTGVDYSGYGYGTSQANANAGNATNDAQQAQWHQQWQQYYAQQAAASSTSAGNAPLQAHPQTQMAPPSQAQGFGYNAVQAGPSLQPQQQSSAAYYGQYSPQQANVNSTSYNWNQPGYGQTRPPPNAYMNAAPPPSAPAQSGYYGLASSPQAGPAAKRARLDNGHMGNTPHSSGIPSRPSHQGRSMGQGSSSAPRAPSAIHPIPGRPAIPPHAGGPSNMAGPMAGGSSRSYGHHSGQRGSRNPAQHHQGGNRSGGGRNSSGGQGSNSTVSGKFNGPMGVNAVGLATGMSRTGFGQGQRNQQMRKNVPGPSRNAPGTQGHQISKSNKSDNNRGGKGTNATKGQSTDKSTQEDAIEMEKAPLLQGRTTYPAESPVPITAKRTFTDFAIHSIEIDPLQWIWQREDEVDDAEDAVEDDKNSNPTNQPDQKKSRRSGRRRSDVRREYYRLRIAFQANAPPAGAPTGPKALANGSSEVNTQTSDADENAQASPSKDSGAGHAPNEGTEVSKSDKADWTPFSRTPPQLSPNRITLSYASAKRKLTIDSKVIKLIEINRAQGTVRIVVDVTTADDPTTINENQQENKSKAKAEEWVIAKGVSLEARNDEQGPYFHVSRPELEACWREKRGSQYNDGEGPSNAPHSRKAKEEGKQETTDVKSDEKKEEVTADHEEESKTKAEDDDKSSKVKKIEEGDKDGESEKPNQSILTDFGSLPPLFRLLASHDGPKNEADDAMIERMRNAGEMTILITLSDSSAKEAKWIRTGNLSEWLSVLPGMQSSITNEPMSSWIAKMYVVDPDPPPVLSDVYDEWVKKSFIATALQRRNFLQEYSLDAGPGLTELIARMVNVQSSDRSPNSINTPTEKELAEPLTEAMKETLFDSHHSHFSLVVWTLTRLLLQSSQNHAVDEGEDKYGEVLKKIRELILSIPMHILFRALDGLCKEAIDKQRMQSSLSRRNKQQNQNMNSPNLSKGTQVEVSANGDITTSVEPSSRSTSVQPNESDSKVVEVKAEQSSLITDVDRSTVEDEDSAPNEVITEDDNLQSKDAESIAEVTSTVDSSTVATASQNV